MEFLQQPPLQLLLATAVVVVTAAALLLSSAALVRRNRKPGRRYHPVVGTIVHQFFWFRRLYDYHTQLSRRHKTFRILVAPFQSEVYTNDPAVIEHILRANFHNYGKGDYNYEIMRDLLGDGIFAVDGGKWRHQRKRASYEFSARSLRETSDPVFKKNAARLALAISQAAASHQAIEIQDWFIKSTMDSIFEVTFGIELNCLQGSSEENRKFVRAFDKSNLLINWRYMNPFWKLMRFFNIGSEGTFKDDVRVIDDFVYKLIHSKIARMSNQRNDESYVGKEDIISRFLLESERDLKTLNHQYLRDIALSFVLAGKDTTSGTLAWFFYMLCKHPSVQERIAEEVKEAVGTGESTTLEEFAASITDESLEKMQYLHAALTETLRLYPAVPMDIKLCFSDDTLPDGFEIRGGESIIFQPYIMGRMKYIWGEDAEVFQPERWLDANGIFCPESPFKFTAFQGGPRICLGKEFAYRQMKIFAAVLLRFFIFKLRNEKEAVNYQMTLTLYVDQGLHLHVFPR
uniref:Cytochrome P450 704C1 n=1 Tax=Anthurium amnicola TaxID=1678845 RepID=A0A1D1ZIL6_9ARAE